MRDYSFRYLDAHGRTQASDYCKLIDNDAAIAFGRECLARSDVVEVWAGNKLIVTLKAEPGTNAGAGQPVVAPAPDAPATPDPTRRHPPAQPGAVIVSLPPWTRPPIR